MPASSVPVIAGMTSTVIFASSTLPMLGKALRTRDLGSYSLGNLVLASVGNGIHSVYVFSLPAGPVWALHLFNLMSTALMLLWFIRFETRAARLPGPRDLVPLIRRQAADRRARPGPRSRRSPWRRTPSAPRPRRPR